MTGTKHWSLRSQGGGQIGTHVPQVAIPNPFRGFEVSKQWFGLQIDSYSASKRKSIRFTRASC